MNLSPRQVERTVFNGDEGKVIRKTSKGKVDSSDIKRNLNLSNEP